MEELVIHLKTVMPDSSHHLVKQRLAIGLLFLEHHVMLVLNHRDHTITMVLIYEVFPARIRHDLIITTSREIKEMP